MNADPSTTRNTIAKFTPSLFLYIFLHLIYSFYASLYLFSPSINHLEK